MNLIDFALIVVVLLSVWTGFKRGFIVGALNLSIWLGSLFLAFVGYRYLARFLEDWWPSLGVWTAPLAFLGSLFLIRALLSLTMDRIIRSLDPDLHAHGINRLLGVVPGFINGLVYAVNLSALLLALPISNKVSDATRESRLAGTLAVGADWMNERLAPVFDEAINRTMNKMTTKPGSDETVKLHFKVSDPKVREDLEAEMLQMVNAERKKAGLPPVKADPEMQVVARKHSRDMFARGYFAHKTPEGKSPFDRMKEGSVRFLTAGENLALGQTLEICHRGLMNSPGHRANILHKDFGRLGIGILDGGFYGLMVTQNFRN